MTERGAVLVVGLTTLAFALAAIDARATYGARTTADEPQYLLTALSLAEDVDLDISDELAAERYRPFHEATLDPQTIEITTDGQRLSPHDPLLPVLLAPGTAFGGWAGAKATMALIGALTAMATVWVAVKRFAVPVSTAALVTGVAFAAPPLTSYATQIYPELPAGFLLVCGVGALTGARSRRSDALLVAVTVALPWLSVKYAPLAVVLVAVRLGPEVLSWRSRPAQRPSPAWLATVAVLVVSGVAYLAIHRRVYGGWTVYAAGDHFVGGELDVIGSDPDYVGRTRRLIGLLVDRTFGLVAWTPAYLLLVPSLVSVVRRRVGGGSLLVMLVAVGWATATWVAFTMHGWWWPGRQLVAVLPLAVIAIASLVDRHVALRRLTVAGFVLGAVTWLWLVVEASTGRRTLIVDFADTASPWYRLWARLLPDQSGYALSGADLGLTIGWAVVVLGSALAALPRPPMSDASNREIQ